jgi:parvulin-like peptidyl-prolyl isomerase
MTRIVHHRLDCTRPLLAVLLAACSTAAHTQQPEVVDRIVAKIDSHVLLLSELRELGQFQQVIEGQAQPEDKRLDELIDQWIIEQEAMSAGFKVPSADEIQEAEKKLAEEVGGEDKFRARRQQAGLTEAALERQLRRALFFSRYLDYKFRPAAQISDQAIQDYYDHQFAPEIVARGETPPPLAKVRDQIREVLVNRDISARSERWLAESRSQLKIENFLHAQSSDGSSR